MAYSVMQKSLEPPTVDQLKNAFRGIPGLTAYDALGLCKHNFGILVKNFPIDRATALKKSLDAEGVGAEILDDANLPKLPETFYVNRVDCTPEALLVYDQLGRTADVNWDDVLLIAAGSVLMTEFKETRGQGPPGVKLADGLLGDARLGQGYASAPSMTVDFRVKEEQHERFMLEIILRGAATRYTINADKSAGVLFSYLGPRRTGDLARDFTLLVQDLVNRATRAAINRGAYYIRENSNKLFVYPGKIAFYDEMVWLLWQTSLNQAAS